MFDYSHLLDSDQYEDINQFYNDVDRASYLMSFEELPSSLIDELVEKGDLYLFQLYNKDFSPHSTGKPNLHTLYWRALFSDENLQSRTIKLNGKAELFYRPRQIEAPFTHEKGTILLNKFDRFGKAIPAEIYQEIHDYVNNKIDSQSLSQEAKAGLEEGRFDYREAPYDIVKNRRYAEDQLFFHVPIEFNWAEQGGVNIDNLTQEYVKTTSDIHVIGIDRGERHLLYYSVLNIKGDIVEQGSWNTLSQENISEQGVQKREIPYHGMLKQREDDRAVARQNWQSIDRIKNLKAGYLSHVIHELSKLIIKYRAIIVLENLNKGFKRGRFKVERQVYQKFEVALMNKLNLLSFKSIPPTELGGILRPWQLTRHLVKLDDAGRQNGVVFYVPASYTSVVDPVTGFVNLFHFNKIKVKDLRDFYECFSSLSFDSDKGHFVFSFNYKKLDKYCRVENCPAREWNVISGERSTFDKKHKKTIIIDTTEQLRKLFDDKAIAYRKVRNLLPEILDDSDLLRKMHSSFKLIVQMRYTVDDVDAIVSPALNDEGVNFDTRRQLEGGKLPTNADANGAYNIARKGLLIVNKIKRGEQSRFVTNKEWFKYIMNN